MTQDKIYNPKEVQLKIENFWFDLLKERYNENVYNSIKDIQPKIYEIFVTKDPNSLRFVFPELYLFLDDIKIYLITYSVITTSFRRSSRTAICSLVADQILFYVYQTYFYPIIKGGDKGVKNVKIKQKSKSKKEYDKADIFNSLTKTKKDKWLKLIEASKFKKADLIDNNKLNKKDNEQLISSIIFILEKILIWKGLENFQEIKYKDFIEHVSFYSNSSFEKVENVSLSLNTELNKDLEISIFKIKLGERFVYSFEDANIVKNMWRNGMRSIDVLNTTQSYSQNNEGSLTLDFNENLIQENIDKLTNILPTNLPMVCQPNKWNSKEYGGYLNNNIERKELITGIGANNFHKIYNLNNLYKAVNYLNSLKFKINTEVLEFVYENKSTIFKDYYHSDKTLTDDKINDNILRDFVTLEIAKTFSNIPFYLNTFTDWRGRIYTQSHYLSYQGSDLSLSLIQFNEGQYVSKSGEFFFKVYGANLHDENKISRASYRDRIKWVDDNQDKILNMDMEFILKADSRFAFIAFCLAYKRFKNNKKVYLPIWLDATCSGIHHFATMLKDVELAKSVNVISNTSSSEGLSENVRDIYSEMIEPTYKKIKEFVGQNPSFFRLSNIKITRKLIKPTIMTRVYNVTIKGVCNQLISNFEVIHLDKKDHNELNIIPKESEIDLENGNPLIENIETEIEDDLNEFYGMEINDTELQNKLYFEGKKIIFKAPSINDEENLFLNYKEVYQLAKIMHEALFESYPALKKLFEYFVSVCLAFTKLDIPISWYPPSGLSIEQRYLKTAKAKVSISVGKGKQKTVILKRKLSKTDTRIQTQAILPNIIHSMDASHLILILNKNKVSPIISIHDCFGTLPNNMIDLENLVKLEFINLYSKNNFLEKFHSDLMDILEKNKITYEVNKTEHKVYIYLNNSDLNLNSNKSKKKNRAYNFLITTQRRWINLRAN